MGGGTSVARVDDGVAMAFRETHERVLRYAASRLDAADAEDVASEVFQAAIGKSDSDGVEAVTPAWIMTVTRNKVVDTWRRRGRDQRLSASVVAQQLVRPKPDLAARANDRADVNNALDKLPDSYRCILVMRYIEGWPVYEIATALGISEKAASARIARAKAAMKSQLTP